MPKSDQHRNPSRTAKTDRQAVWCLLPAGLLLVTSCSSQPPSPGAARTVTGNPYPNAGSGYGGQIVVATTTRLDTVVAVDAASRRVELRHPDGRVATYKAGPQVVNFNQIKPGDRVEAKVAEEMALFLAPANSPESTSTNVVVTRAAYGPMPQGQIVETRTYTAKILAINPALDQVTLQLANGQNKTINAPETVNLADFNPGDEVSARITEAALISVQKPSP